MSSDEKDPRDLLGPWALNAVDDLERAMVERAIAADEQLAAEARQMRETVASLAEADAQQPPEGLRESVLAQIHAGTEPDTRRQDPAQQPTDSEHRAGRGSDPGPSEVHPADSDEVSLKRRSRRWPVWAAAAGIVIAAAIPTSVAVNLSEQADQSEQQRAQEQQRAEQTQEQLEQMTQMLMDPSAEMVTEELDDGSYTVAVLAESSAMFMANGMPELEEQDYQLWILDGDEAIDAGVLEFHDGQLSAQVEDFPAHADLAVTAEPEGGSEQPTSDPMVVLGISD